MKIIRYIIAVAFILLLFIGTHAIFKYAIKMHTDTIRILGAIIVLYSIISIPVVYILKTKLEDLKHNTSNLDKIITPLLFTGIAYLVSIILVANYWDSLNSPAKKIDMVALPGENFKMKVTLLSVPEGCYRTNGYGSVQMDNKNIFPYPIPIDYQRKKRWGNSIKSRGCSPGYNHVGFTPVEIPVSLPLPKDINITEPVKLSGTVAMPLYYAKLKGKNSFENVNEVVQSDISFWAFPASWHSAVHRAKGYRILTIIFGIAGFFWFLIGGAILFLWAGLPAKLKHDK